MVLRIVGVLILAVLVWGTAAPGEQSPADPDLFSALTATNQACTLVLSR